VSPQAAKTARSTTTQRVLSDRIIKNEPKTQNQLLAPFFSNLLDRRMSASAISLAQILG
jgi:hypothetical protein